MIKTNTIQKKFTKKKGRGIIKMKIKELLKEYNIETNIPETLKEHTVGLIMPPVDQYTYKQEEGKHIFTKTTESITDTITIDENEKIIMFEKESEGLPTAGYILHEDGSEDLM